MPTGGQYYRDTNTPYMSIGVYCGGEDQANGYTSLQATKASPATPVPYSGTINYRMYGWII